jgi:hypothetical protein
MAGHVRAFAFLLTFAVAQPGADRRRLHHVSRLPARRRRDRDERRLPTQEHFDVQHIHWYKVRDGHIVEHTANRDDIGMMRQLGLLPPASAAAN